jgi:hypothetical protein
VLPIAKCSAAQVKIVRRAIVEDGNGIAFRYPVLSSLPMSVRDLVLARLEQVDVRLAEVDLMLDLEWISPDGQVDVDGVATVIDRFASLGQFRRIILLGTSIPSSMSCIPEGTLGELMRNEWALWQALRRRGIAHMPIFGDYAVQHPAPSLDPNSKGGGPGMRANIRYTVGDRTIVARGRGPVLKVGKQQYNELCQSILSHPEYAGSAFSAGDQVIRECAEGVREPGAQSLWREVGTSHHVNMVVRQLDAV